ncbi:MAG TPA: RES family NAD+ phosphorylase [Burkholderiales bacterium]|nr:RES family NAD+ phosphorylase [Burkholderiales bacterium]
MFDELIDRNVDFRGDLVRNIKTIRAPQNLFDDLSRDPRDWDVAWAAEAEERIPTPASIITRPFDYGTVISYSFDPSNWQATRYSDGRRYGVWYGSCEVETTIYETVFHWHRFLVDSYASEDRIIAGERRVFDVRCEALLIDLRGKEMTYPDLISRTSYAFTQSLAGFLQEQGTNGVLVRSARAQGINGAIFRAERLSNVRDRMLLTYRCNPTIDLCKIERASGRTWMQVRPSTLY